MSTGLWAPAAAVITIKIEASSPNVDVAKANLGVQIGSHNGNLRLCRSRFCRPPDGVHVVKWFGNKPHDGGSLPGTDTLVMANSWGGLIYILVPKVLMHADVPAPHHAAVLAHQHAGPMT